MPEGTIGPIGTVRSEMPVENEDSVTVEANTPVANPYDTGGGVPFTFESVCHQLDVVANAVMVDRQRKYGPENIRVSGEIGLLVRIRDKLARLEHSEEDFDDESFEDALIDVRNYATIWVLLRRGQWGLPLEVDAGE